MKLKYRLLLFVIFASFFLTGCGESRALKEFRTDFDSFCSDVARIDASINGIDAAAEDSVLTLLTLLDELELKFQELAELSIPKEFSYLEELADEAGENMSLAVENYHHAFESEPYDAASADVAAQYYERAYKRVRYMITFLHGDVPEDENVQILEE